MKKLKRTRLLALSTGALACSVWMPSPVQACLDCDFSMQFVEDDVWYDARDKFDVKIESEFYKLQRFIAHDMWEQSILPAMELMAEQFTVVALQQMLAIGTFIDAESQMNAQRSLQEIQARIHKKYQPSVGMCEFGSLMKSLAASERRGELSAFALSQRAQDRHLGQSDTVGAYGHQLEKLTRIYQFKDVFCNEHDRGNALDNICTSRVDWSSADFAENDRVRINKDIDFVSLMETPNTLTLNFTNSTIRKLDDPDTATVESSIRNEDEEHVLAMSTNLFGHDGFTRVPGKLLTHETDRPDLNAAQKAYLELRSLVAKRSVAENSFNAIAGLKTEGVSYPDEDTTDPDDYIPPSATPYMHAILRDLGVVDPTPTDTSDDEARIKAYLKHELGDYPSYFAQMEVLTKKIYQNPNFYTNLYDTPANVERKGVALQAIKLMQKFDMLKSFLRNEASVSLLLEFAVIDLQEEVENQILALDSSVGQE